MNQAPAVSMRSRAPRSRTTRFASLGGVASEAPAASSSGPAATIHAPASDRTTPSCPTSRVTEGVVVTKRSGQAQSALISRGPPPVEPTRARHAGGDQGKNKPSTKSETPRRNSNSPTRANRILCADRRRRRQDCRFVFATFPSRPTVNRTMVRQAGKAPSKSATWRIFERGSTLSRPPSTVKSGC